MTTIAQQLNIQEFPFIIRDSKGKEIYFEDLNGYWWRREYDSKGNLIYFENSDGYWVKTEFDSNGNRIYFETSNGYWYKKEFDSTGDRIYFENSNGIVQDKRPKQIVELTMEELTQRLGYEVKIKK